MTEANTEKRIRPAFAIAALVLLVCGLAMWLRTPVAKTSGENEALLEQEKAPEYQAHDVSALVADYHAGLLELFPERSAWDEKDNYTPRHKADTAAVLQRLEEIASLAGRGRFSHRIEPARVLAAGGPEVQADVDELLTASKRLKSVVRAGERGVLLETNVIEVPVAELPKLLAGLELANPGEAIVLEPHEVAQVLGRLKDHSINKAQIFSLPGEQASLWMAGNTQSFIGDYDLGGDRANPVARTLGIGMRSHFRAWFWGPPQQERIRLRFDYRVCNIVDTTVHLVECAWRPPPPRPPEAPKIKAAPEPGPMIATLQFNERPLKEVLDYLSTAMGKQIRAAKERDEKLPITFKLENITCRTVLDFICKKYGMVIDDSLAAKNTILLTGPTKVSMRFVNADIRDVVKSLTMQEGNIKVVVDDEVKGLLSMRFENVPWRDALDIVVKTLDYVSVEEPENTFLITVKNKVPLKIRIFRIEYLTLPAEELFLVGEFGVRNDGANLVLDPTHIKSLIQVLQMVLTPRGKITVEPRTRTLIVNDTQQGIDDIESILAKLDTPEGAAAAVPTRSWPFHWLWKPDTPEAADAVAQPNRETSLPLQQLHLQRAEGQCVAELANGGAFIACILPKESAMKERLPVIGTLRPEMTALEFPQLLKQAPDAKVTSSVRGVDVNENKNLEVKGEKAYLLIVKARLAEPPEDPRKTIPSQVPPPPPPALAPFAPEELF